MLLPSATLSVALLFFSVFHFFSFIHGILLSLCFAPLIIHPTDRDCCHWRSRVKYHQLFVQFTFALLLLLPFIFIGEFSLFKLIMLNMTNGLCSSLLLWPFRHNIIYSDEHDSILETLNFISFSLLLAVIHSPGSLQAGIGRHCS